MAKLTIAEMQARAAVEKPAPGMPVIKVGMSTCGMAAGAEAVFATLGQEVQARGLDARVARTGCAGMCSMEPLVEVKLPGEPAVMYGGVPRTSRSPPNSECRASVSWPACPASRSVRVASPSSTAS